MPNIEETKYRWFILVLAFFTNVIVIAIPSMCMPVLFKEISQDLGLSLVQLGAVWGMGGLAGIFTSLAGGLIGDRFGSKHTISTICILAGIAGAARGLSGNFIGLAVTMFLFGMLAMTLSLNIHKSAGVWFSGKQVVMANGVVSAGMAFGFMIGAMISDTIMSPLLGGWKNVMFLYGAISILLGIVWMMTKRETVPNKTADSAESPSFSYVLGQVVRIKSIWILAVSTLFYGSAVNGFTGFLPLFLRESGWIPAKADGALAAYNAAGMLAAIPLTLISSRLNSRKKVLIPGLIIGCIGIGLFSVIEGVIIWLLAVLVGFMRDAYYAILATMAIETRGIGAVFAGTAIGLVWSFGSLGGFLGPPIGNYLAVIRPGYAFIFWAVCLLGSAVMLHLIKEGKQV